MLLPTAYRKRLVHDMETHYTVAHSETCWRIKNSSPQYAASFLHLMTITNFYKKKKEKKKGNFFRNHNFYTTRAMALKQLHYDSDPREITGRRVKAIQNSCPLHLYYSQQLVPLQLYFTGSMLDG